jgi:hypothetical protein
MAANESRLREAREPLHLSSRPAQPAANMVLNLRAYALAALAAKIVGGATAPDEAPELRILFELFDDVRRQGNWVDSFFAYLQKPNNADAALIDCRTALGLDAVEVLAISLTAAVEDDLMIGRMLARLQAPVGGSRPTLGLLEFSLRADLAKRKQRDRYPVDRNRNSEWMADVDERRGAAAGTNCRGSAALVSGIERP